MEGDKPFGQISGEVPQELIDAFDACISRLGITKKRAIAAAVHAFVSGAADVQHEWLRAVYDRYYGSAGSADAAIRGSASEVGKRAGAAVARGGSKQRPTTGKSSA